MARAVVDGKSDSLWVRERRPNAGGENPTEVHLEIALDLPDTELAVVVRFKGTDTLDRFITALVVHRNSVWGAG